jgi:hypothetical protein
MGTSQSKNNSDTINWNNIYTDDMNSSIPGMKGGLSNDAKQLLNKINLPEISETNSVNDFDLNNMMDDNKNHTNLQKNEDLTASPFISSEMYNYLLNKRTDNNNNILKGGALEGDDEEDTSSTSSNDNDDDDDDDSEEIDQPNDTEATDDTDDTDIKPKKKDKKDKKKDKKDKTVAKIGNDIDLNEFDIDPNVEIYKGKRKPKSKSKKAYKNKIKKSENYLSYVSSSAHTGKSLSGSVLNENNYTISSINTSDINMISE